jgi:carbohydrate-selective porin OprB
VGAYWLKRSNDIDQALRDLIEDEVGLEVFYNVAVVPSVQLTFDLQWINSGIRTNDDAVVLGMRLMTPF